MHLVKTIPASFMFCQKKLCCHKMFMPPDLFAAQKLKQNHKPNDFHCLLLNFYGLPTDVL
jgi:hypothetical protein